MYLFKYIASYQRFIKVSMELLGETISIVMEGVEGGYDLGAGKGVHAIDPTIAGGDVHENKSVVKATESETIAVHYVKVYFIKVTTALLDGFSGRRFGKGSKVAKSEW